MVAVWLDLLIVYRTIAQYVGTTLYLNKKQKSCVSISHAKRRLKTPHMEQNPRYLDNKCHYFRHCAQVRIILLRISVVAACPIRCLSRQRHTHSITRKICTLTLPAQCAVQQVFVVQHTCPSMIDAVAINDVHGPVKRLVYAACYNSSNHVVPKKNPRTRYRASLCMNRKKNAKGGKSDLACCMSSTLSNAYQTWAPCSIAMWYQLNPEAGFQAPCPREHDIIMLHPTAQHLARTHSWKAPLYNGCTVSH